MQVRLGYPILFLLLLLAALTSLVPGCRKREADSTGLVMPFLICASTQSRDGMMVYAGKWNIDSGVVLVSESSIMKLSGPLYRSSIALWDGGSTFRLKYPQVRAVEVSESVEVSYLIPKSVSKTFFGNGLVLRVDDDSYLVTPQDGDEFRIESVSAEFEANGTTFTLSDSYLIGAGIRGRNACFVYRYTHPGDYLRTYLYYALYDPKEGTWDWSELISVPREYAEEVVVLSPYWSSYFDGNGLYLCGGETICYLDIQNQQFVPLLEISNAVDDVIPGTVREQDMDGRILPTQIVGGLADVVVCGMGLQSETSDETYTVYYAVRDRRLLGILVMNGNSIACYDSDLQLLKKNYIDEDIILEPAPIRFPSYHYRY